MTDDTDTTQATTETIDLPIGHARTLEAHDDGTEEWHAQRAKGIGGSDAATIIGLKPYGLDRETLWRRKTDREAPFAGNAATDFGTKIEPYIFRRCAINHDSEVVECDAGLAHPDRPWQRGHVDGLLVERDATTPDAREVAGIVEIKTSTQPAPDQGCSDVHYAQIQHYLSVTGLDRAAYVYFEVPFDREHALTIADRFVDDGQVDDYWQWVAESGELTIRTIDRDDGYIDRLVEAERDFWTCVKSDENPGPYLRDDEVALDDPAIAEAIREYGIAKARLDLHEELPTYQDAEAQKEEAKETAKTKLASVDAKRAILPDGDKATFIERGESGYWRLYPTDRTDYVREAEEAPDDESVDVPF